MEKYEVLAPGYKEWSRLEAVVSRFGGGPHEYDAFSTSGTRLPFYMPLRADRPPPSAGAYVGNARIFQGSSARAFFAFGIATEPGDLPVSGTMICRFGEDEIGDGELAFDLAAGTVSGWVNPFWAAVRYSLVQTSFAPAATTVSTAFGTDGVLEGRFFGPRAVNIAVRAKGPVSGIMTGTCER